MINYQNKSNKVLVLRQKGGNRTRKHYYWTPGFRRIINQSHPMTNLGKSGHGWAIPTVVASDVISSS